MEIEYWTIPDGWYPGWLGGESDPGKEGNYYSGVRLDHQGTVMVHSEDHDRGQHVRVDVIHGKRIYHASKWFRKRRGGSLTRAAQRRAYGMIQEIRRKI